MSVKAFAALRRHQQTQPLLECCWEALGSRGHGCVSANTNPLDISGVHALVELLSRGTESKGHLKGVSTVLKMSRWKGSLRGFVHLMMSVW